MSGRGTAVVTGASSGIGAATARALAAEGFDVVIGARRVDRLEALADEIGASVRSLDVTDPASVDGFCAEVDDCRLLVNNAGGALGLDPVADADEEQWRWMYETNVLGVLRMTKALLPKLLDSGDGHVIVIGSIAAHEAYPGGAGYNAAKFGARAVMRGLRQELLGQPGAGHRDRPRHGRDRVQHRALRRRPRAGRRGLRRCHPAHRRRRRRVHRVRRHPSSHVNIDEMIVLARDQTGPARSTDGSEPARRTR